MTKVSAIRPMSRRNPRHGADCRSGTSDVVWRRALMDSAGGGPHRRRRCRAAAAEPSGRPPARAVQGERLSVASRRNVGLTGEKALDLSIDSPRAPASRSSKLAARPAPRRPRRDRAARPGAAQRPSASGVTRQRASGCRAKVPVPRHGRVEQHDLRRPDRWLRRVGDDDVFPPAACPGEILRQPPGARRD